MVIRLNFGKSLKNFADRTSIDGVNEISNAKTYFWKIVWIIIVVVAVGLTGFQVERSLQQYIGADYDTVITPAKRTQIRYPAIRLCYAHWIYWVDWRRAKSLGFSKSATLFGLSYISKGFSSENFNLDAAKADFFETFRKNKMIKLKEFYSAISLTVPLFSGSSVNSSYFEDTELVYKNPNLLYCYIMKEEKVFEFLQLQENLSNSLSNLVLTMRLSQKNYIDIEDNLTLEEYQYHLAYYFAQVYRYDLTDNVSIDNFRNAFLPIYLYPNAYGSEFVRILPEIECFFVTFRVTAHKRRNKIEEKCLENKESVLPDDGCFRKCHIMYFVGKCKCLYVDNAIFIDKAYPEKLCPEAIHFLPLQNLSSLLQPANQNCETEFPDYVENDKKCINLCLPACNTWSYDMTISAMTKSNLGLSGFEKSRINNGSVEVKIKYADAEDVLILTETDPWSWEDLVGNIGGLLGIWMGASVVSFVQLIYLCCCAEHEIDLFPEKRNSSVAIISTVKEAKGTK